MALVSRPTASRSRASTSAGPALARMTSSTPQSALSATRPASVTTAISGTPRPVACSMRQVARASESSERASTSTASGLGAGRPGCARRAERCAPCGAAGRARAARRMARRHGRSPAAGSPHDHLRPRGRGRAVTSRRLATGVALDWRVPASLTGGFSAVSDSRSPCRTAVVSCYPSVTLAPIAGWSYDSVASRDARTRASGLARSGRVPLARRPTAAARRGAGAPRPPAAPARPARRPRRRARADAGERRPAGRAPARPGRARRRGATGRSRSSRYGGCCRWPSPGSPRCSASA